MIPILYEKDETAFLSNGICRLRDAISFLVTEERNSIFEADFEYPVDGANYEQIQCGRIVAVTHDETGDVQPFDIVSYSRPINGVVTFHAVHISYRMTKLTVSGTNINSLSGALTLLSNSAPANPFSFSTDMTSNAYMAAADGTPRSVRQMIGGVQGSILDTYGGELVWDKWNVILKYSRGQARDFAIRYGVNLLDYKEDTDYSNTFNACIPFWKGQNGNGVDVIVKGNKVTSGASTYGGREMCVPLDLTDKFETTPTTAQLEAMASTYMQSNNTTLPSQSINVDFVRLSEMGEFSQFQDLLTCSLCDTLNVIFPMYNVQASFKIVKTVWNVLRGTYESMELGTLSQTLSEALGITNDLPSNSTSGLGIHDANLSTTYGGYIAFDNGFVVQWAFNKPCTTDNTMTQIGSSTSSTYYSMASFDLEYPVVASNGATMCSGSTRYSTGHRVAFGFAGMNTTTQARINAFDYYARPSDSNWKVFYMLVGKWK